MLNSSTLTETRYDGSLVIQMFKELLPVQILSSVVPYLASIANGIVVGNALSAESIIALGLVAPMTNLFGAIASIIAGGAKILSGRSIGRGEHEKLNNIFSCALMAAFFIGIILTVGIFIFAKPIAVLLGAKEIATEETMLYVRGIALGIIPTLMIPSFTVFLQMGNESTYALLATVLLAACNFTGDILCVKVIGGGMLAIGIATAISQFIAIAFLVVRFIQKEDLMKFNIKYFIKSLTKDLIILGSPTAIAILLYSVRNAIFNIQVIKWGGEIAASANSIVNLIMGPLDGINVGTGATVLMLASIFVGEKDKEALKSLLKFGFKIGLALAGAKCLLMITLGKPLAIAFGAAGDVISECYIFQLILGFNFFFNMITQCMVGIHSSFARVKFINIFYLFGAFIFPLAFSLIFCPLINQLGVYLAYIVAEILGLVVMYVYSVKVLGHKISCISDLILFPEDFNFKNKISMTILTMDDVVNISKEIVDFCKSNKIDDKKSYYCGLCIEEMASSVVLNGFVDSAKKKNRIDLLVSCEDENIFVRMRDNTAKYDVVKNLGAFDPEDPCKNIGARMVSKLAREMTYQCSFNMNVLTIEL